MSGLQAWRGNMIWWRMSLLVPPLPGPAPFPFYPLSTLPLPRNAHTLLQPSPHTRPIVRILEVGGQLFFQGGHNVEYIYWCTICQVQYIYWGFVFFKKMPPSSTGLLPTHPHNAQSSPCPHWQAGLQLRVDRVVQVSPPVLLSPRVA